MTCGIITKKCFVSVLICLTAFASLTASQVRYTTAYGRNYVYLRDVARYYGMDCDTSGKTTTLSSKYSRLVFTVDKKYCYINNVKVDLLFSAIKHNQYRCISNMDFLKVIDPIMRHWALRKHKLTKIMLDPGHGGKDKGGIGKKLNEKMLTLPLARKVASLLRNAGYQVVLTRDSDYFIDLEKRPALAEKAQADIFISIHANKTASISVSGIESFCLTPVGAASTHSRTPSLKKYKGNSQDANNAALAYWLQRSLVEKTKAADRGVKHARYMVLKESSCPSALVEVGFLSNPNEERLIGTEWYQWKIAQGIADGIRRYHYQISRQK